MAIGVTGPIGTDALGDFAISRAVRLVANGKTNVSTAGCKVCGESLAKGEGRRVLIASMATGEFDGAYLCAGCAARVAQCAARFLPASPSSGG